MNRTTRSVAPTEAGERLLQTLSPALQSLDASLEALSMLRARPAGTIRISSVEHASTTLIAPVLAKLLPDYPDIQIEIINDYRLTDIVVERFDAGVRLGEQVDQDMIAVPIGPDFERAVVASPAYFATRRRPRTPHDLTEHACINLRLPTSGGLWVWPFARDGRELNVRAQGPITFNTITLSLDAARAGLGLALLPLDMVQRDIAQGRLVQVLSDWTPPTVCYHLYYPRRRQPAQAFTVLVEALRYRSDQRH